MLHLPLLSDKFPSPENLLRYERDWLKISPQTASSVPDRHTQPRMWYFKKMILSLRHTLTHTRHTHTHTTYYTPHTYTPHLTYHTYTHTTHTHHTIYTHTPHTYTHTPHTHTHTHTTPHKHAHTPHILTHTHTKDFVCSWIKNNVHCVTEHWGVGTISIWILTTLQTDKTPRPSLKICDSGSSQSKIF